MSGRLIGLARAIAVEPESEALTRRNQEVLIGGVYRPDRAQVSPMRHRRGPALPGASAKWDENTIKCQDQLNNQCIRPGWAAVSRCAAERMRGMFGVMRKCCRGQQTGHKSSGCRLSPNHQSTSPWTGQDTGWMSNLLMASGAGRDRLRPHRPLASSVAFKDLTRFSNSTVSKTSPFSSLRN